MMMASCLLSSAVPPPPPLPGVNNTTSTTSTTVAAAVAAATNNVNGTSNKSESNSNNLIDSNNKQFSVMNHNHNQNQNFHRFNNGQHLHYHHQQPNGHHNQHHQHNHHHHQNDHHLNNGNSDYSLMTMSSKVVSSETRIVKLQRLGNKPLGFSVRGGSEHGTGIFVSEVHQGSEADREGLRPGDEILRVNGFSVEHAIHEEVIALIRSGSRVTLKVKSVGMIPVRENVGQCLSWKYVDSSNCPVHSNTNSNSSSSVHWLSQSDSTKAPLSQTISDPPSTTSSRSTTSSTGSSTAADAELFSNFALTSNSNDYMEAKVFVNLSDGQGLGCSVVKGPKSYPGIYVQVVKRGGIAEESGLEVGDQIIGINGTSLEPGEIEFNEAISMIKSCHQMTLTVRKRSGLNLFRSQKQSRLSGKASSLATNNSLSNPRSSSSSDPSDSSYNQHSPLCSKQSVSSCGSSDLTRGGYYLDQSEHDYSMSEMESNGGERIYKLPLMMTTCGGGSGHSVPLQFPHAQPKSIPEEQSGRKLHRVNKSGNSGQDNSNGQSNNNNPVAIANAQKIYDEVRKEEERLAEERKKLEVEQKRLQMELEKLEKERKQLENLKQDECKSISSSSTVSGTCQSISSTSSGSGGSSSGAASQISFLDEIKKLAEKRNGENSLITNTLNKTKPRKERGAEEEEGDENGSHRPSGQCGGSKLFGPDGDKRKRHELLMEEFRAAHSKMFGAQGPKLRSVSTALTNAAAAASSTSTSNPDVTRVGNSNITTNNGHHNNNYQHHHPNNDGNSPVCTPSPLPPSPPAFKQPVAHTKSAPPAPQQSANNPPTTFTNVNGEKVTILRTTSPTKKNPPPPVPKKANGHSNGCGGVTAGGGQPIVTISTYDSSQSKNRFIINENKSVIQVTSNNEHDFNGTGQHAYNNCSNNGSGQFVNENHSQNNVVTTSRKPISIKINLQKSPTTITE